jgi:hypothetical protein
MREFAEWTGLDPPTVRPRRYLWTDAFAVCNYLGLFRTTGDPLYRELALRLVGQVHTTLGRYRDGDTRTGWISGLSAGEGGRHPTVGGLRIGKPEPERNRDDPYDENREWDRDGQYFHYLTKWMHALSCTAEVTGNPVFGTWAAELAHTAHARFTYLPRHAARKRMYWKMSTDLSLPLVPSMGQHDPLDGLVTYAELQAGGWVTGEDSLDPEITDMDDLVRDLPLETDDPLGIGGLLFDAGRIARLAVPDRPVSPDLLERVMDAALAGLSSYAGSHSLEYAARHRLAFRELGLSAGLAGSEMFPSWIRANPHLSGRAGPLLSRAEEIRGFVPLRSTIEGFWLEGKNRTSESWTNHRDINTVMLATSLAPDGFLMI